MAAPLPAFGQVRTRAATSADEAFLFDLYSAVRGPEFAGLPLPEEQRAHLMKMQFTAQMNSYRDFYPGSNYEIVMFDGEPVGRIWVACSDRSFHLVDIAVHPRVQSRGIGTLLLRDLQRLASESGKQIVSSVVRFNAGSLRFHQRLGFRIVAEGEVMVNLMWDADR